MSNHIIYVATAEEALHLELDRETAPGLALADPGTRIIVDPEKAAA